MTGHHEQDDKLLAYAEKSAKGELIDEPTDDNVKAFNIISKIKNSFEKTSENGIQLTLKSGDQWGHLVLGEEIGAGGMGQVYEAYDKLLERMVAVKFLNSHAISYIDSHAFIEEARRLAKIRHPNVLAIFGANTFKNLTGFWSERLTGESLEALAIEKLHWSNVLKIASDLTSALEEVHKNQLIHGDIKPQNVILEPVKGAVLMDFGSGYDDSKTLNSITSSTPLIMAPELFNGGHKNQASDVYALGVLFYYISSKKHYPYHAKSMTDLANKVKVKKSHVKSISAGSKQWKVLVNTMLSINPENRPNIEQVQTIITEIKQTPLKRVKRLAISSVILLLLGISTTVLYSNYKLKAANQTTTLALNETTQVNQLLQNLFSYASATSQGKDLLMVDAIDEFTAEIDNSEDVSNSVKAKALSTLAKTLRSLGYQQKSIAVIDKTLDYDDTGPLIRSQLLNIKSRLLITDLKASKAQIMQAEDLLNQAKESLKYTTIDDPQINAKINITDALISKLNNDNHAAKQYVVASINYWETTDNSKEKYLNLGISYDLLGQVNFNLGLFDDAVGNYNQAINNYEHVSRKFNSNIMGTMNNLAGLYGDMGQVEKAKDQFKILVEKSESFLGRNHPSRLLLIANYASALNSNGDFEQSLELLHVYAPVITEVIGTDSQLFFFCQGVIANNYKSLKKYVQAEAKYQEIIEKSAAVWGANHYMTFLTQSNLAELYIESNKLEAASSLLASVVDEVESTLGAKNMVTLEVKELYAWSSFLLGDSKAPQSILEAVIAVKKEVYGERNESTQKAISRLNQIKEQSSQ